MSEPPVPDADLVLHGLDAEIRRLVDESRPPGWTNWAILAGLGALLWALAGVSSQVQLTRATANLILTFGLCLDVVLFVYSFLTTKTPEGPLRFRRGSEDSNMRLTYLMTIIWAGGILWLGRWLTGGWWSWSLLGLLWAYGLVCLLSAAAIVLTITDQPFRISSPEYRRATMWLIASMGVGIGVGAVHFLGVAAQDWLSHRLVEVDLKFAGIVVACFFLLGRIAADVKSPAIEILERTRRELAFGRIDPTAAVQQAEIAVLGRRFSELFQEDVARQLARYEEARSYVVRASGRLQGLFDTMPEVPPFTTAQYEVIRAVMEGVKTDMVSLRRISGESAEGDKKLRQRANRGPAEERDLILSRLQEGLGQLGADLDKLNKQMEVALERFK